MKFKLKYQIYFILIYNNELNDDEFMLRLRFPAGRITNESLLLIANISQKYKLKIREARFRQ